MEFIDAKEAAALVAGADRRDRKEIEALAQQRLHFLVDYAREHSPYLKEKYADLPDNYGLADIPISTREEMTQQFDRWVSDPEITSEKVNEYLADFENLFTPFLGKYRVISTSGTTAKPLRIIRDSRHLAIHDALMAQRYFGGPLLKDVEGLDEPDLKQCAIISPGGMNSSYLSFERLRRSYKARGMEDRTLFLSTLTPPEEMILKLNAFQPDIIGCYPSVIYSLAFEQQAGRLDIHPKIIGCSAEKLPEENRKFISEVFGCPVNDNYCSTEGGEVAMLCPNGHMHVNSDWVIVEPVDRENNPVPCGVKSEGILMTNLACLVQPVIRYHMSDSVIMHDEICGCGLNTPWIEIEGRVEDVLEFDRNGTAVRIPGFLFQVCTDEFSGCDHCQVIQRAPDAIEIRASIQQGYDRIETEQKLLFAIRKFLEGNGLHSIRIELVDKPLQRTRSGKLRIAFKDFV